MRQYRHKGWTLAIAVMLSVTVVSACGGGSSKSSQSTATTSVQVKGKTVGADPSDQSAGDPSQAAYTPTGEIVADDGFRPADNGFPFQNYGAQLADGSAQAAGLTATEMQQLYGKAVCANDNCDLTPEAQAYMDKSNKDMAGGHCFGFSVAAELLWSGKLNASDYGADNTAALSINDNAKLMGTIAYAWMFQTLPTVQQQFVQGDPNTILEKLKEVLKQNPDETYTVRIFHGTGGHAVTPYAVEDNGNGLFHVLVWDNNYVGVTRAIEFDTNANTWKYNAALNPNEPSEQYSGDAQTPNIDLDPSSPGLETQPWPYAGSVGSDASQSSTANAGGATLAAMKSENNAPDTNLIYLDASETDHAHLLITNPKGEKIGFENGKLVNTMAGAHTVIHALNANWNEHPEPEYEVPDGVDYTIKLDATDMKEEDDDVSIGVIAPGYELYVDNLNVQPGETDTLKASVDAEKLEFTPSEQQSPSIEVGISTDKEDWTFTVNGDVVPAGATDSIDLPIDGDTMTVSTAGSADPSEVSLAVERIDDNGEQHFSHDGISLDDGDSAALKYGGWTDGATMPLTVNHAGQKQTQQLSDDG